MHGQKAIGSVITVRLSKRLVSEPPYAIICGQEQEIISMRRYILKTDGMKKPLTIWLIIILVININYNAGTIEN